MSEQLDPREIISGVPVESFRSASFHKDPLIYPGERPSASYITDGETVSSLSIGPADKGLDIRVFEAGQWQAIDEYLAAKNAPLMDQRIPVLAFGANMNPASLRAKFEKTGRADMQVVPTAYAMLEGSDVVWSGGPGINGNFTACLYSGPETEESEVEVGVSFVTPAQLLVLHATELNYQFAETLVRIAGEYMPVYYYAGQDSVYLEDGMPVAIKNIPALNRALPEHSGVEMVQMMLSQDGVLAGISTQNPDFPTRFDGPQDYVEYVRSLRKVEGRPEPKLAFKKMVQGVLAESGLTAMTREDAEGYESWANPSTLRTYKDWRLGGRPSQIHVLPTSEIPKDSWPNPAARAKVIRGVIAHDERNSDRHKS